MEKYFSLLAYIVVLLRRKKLLSICFLLSFCASVIYAFFIAEKQFATSITFFPPTSESRGISNLLSGFDLTGVFGTDIMPEQIVTVFNSNALRIRVIDRFNLYEKYKIKHKPGKLVLALKRLENDMELENEEAGKMGISRFVSYTLRTYHTSKDTSYAMAEFVFGLVDSVIRDVSIDRGRRDRIFVEKQLEDARVKLDSIQGAFREFQVANKAYNMPEQVGAALRSYSQVKASIIANEIQIKRLQGDYNNSYGTISSLEKTNSVLEEKLASLEKTASPDVLVGLQVSTELMPRYSNFLRDIEVQNELILLMAQEYEQAKLKEARDVSALKIIDPPYIPDYKARPKRILLVAAITVIFMMIICAAVICGHLYSARFVGSETYKQIISAMRRQ